MKTNPSIKAIVAEIIEIIIDQTEHSPTIGVATDITNDNNNLIIDNNSYFPLLSVAFLLKFFAVRLLVL